MSAADVHSILYRGTDPLQQKFEPAKDKKTTVPRYWPGKAPEKADEEAGGASSDEERGIVEKQQRMQAVLQENRRLHRLARAASTLKPDIEERRQIHAAILLEAEKERRRREAFEAAKKSKEEQDASRGKQGIPGSTEEAREERRLLALQKRKEEEQLLEQQQQQLEEDEEELSSSDYSDGSEDYEDPAPRVLHKPVFVPKDKRESAKERARQEAEAAKQREEEEQRALERKRASKQMLYAALQKEEEELRTAASNEAKEDEEEEMPDDTDGIDPELEYEEWKVRELHRIKRDQEERQARDKFLEALEHRRQMSEEERKADDKQLDMMHPRREVKYKYNFMQKYFHRGAFFQDMARSGEEPIYLRDFNAPVGEDKWDKKILPAAMRLRRGEFGRQGQTKHTHLVDVDTTDFSSAWAFNTKLKEKTESKMGGEVERGDAPGCAQEAKSSLHSPPAGARGYPWYQRSSGHGRKGAKDFDRPSTKPRK